MKRFILYFLKTAVCVLLIFTGLIGSLVVYPAGTFADTYQAVLQKKFDVLMRTEEPKIIIVGGSNAGFGINEALLEEETGYKVANLGLHAGFGAIVPTELAKANINEGDIVLLAYEWGWLKPGYFDTFGTDLVTSAFDHRLDMYRWLPAEHYSKILGYLFQHAEKKRENVSYSGVYSSKSFDGQGRMILDRPEMIMPYEGNETTYGAINITDTQIPEDVATYLIEFKAYVEQQNASVYFVAPPLYEGARRSTPEDFARIPVLTEETLGIAYISDPNDYIFSGEYMYDTIYHCNSTGEIYRTQLLAEDLRNAGICP